MKKFFRLSLILTLAISFILMVTGYASAMPMLPPKISVPDPFAIPSIDGAKMTSEVVGVPVLPGTLVLSSGKYGPVGYKEGDAQFGGSGLKISSLETRVTATLCFPFRDYNFKWKGVVSQWNGEKWTALTTYFPADAEGVTNWACTKGAGNGTYALITWYYGPPEPTYNIIPDTFIV